jgi:hypothetical protein
MTQLDHALSFKGDMLRISRLDSSGNLVKSDEASYVTKAFVSVAFTPEYEDGETYTQTNASGSKCLNIQDPDVLTQMTLEIAVCAPGPEITEIISGGTILTRSISETEGGVATTYAVGWGSPKIGVTDREDGASGVSVEVWSSAGEGDSLASTKPYWHWIFPKTFLRPSGTRTIEAGVLASTFEGWGVGNINFGTGPDGKWEWPTEMDRPLVYARVDESDLPTAYDLQPITGS